MWSNRQIHWDTTAFGPHPLSSIVTPPLTIQNIEWEIRDWGKVLKVTFAENINYGSGIFKRQGTTKVLLWKTK